MSDYQKGKIYQINTSLGPEVYYGSTTTPLNERMTRHKTHLLCTAQLIFKKYGFENCKIELVEDYPCNSKKELETRERFYIENNVCINKCIPTRTDAEYRKDNTERIRTQSKQYYINNIEKIRERQTTQITCICGVIICKTSKAKHERTKKHIESMK
jgi:hypothetical protein